MTINLEDFQNSYSTLTHHRYRMKFYCLLIYPSLSTRYYVRLNISDGNPLQSTWTEPVQFSKLVRQIHS